MISLSILYKYVYIERMVSNKYETDVGCGANTFTDALIHADVFARSR